MQHGQRVPDQSLSVGTIQTFTAIRVSLPHREPAASVIDPTRRRKAGNRMLAIVDVLIMFHLPIEPVEVILHALEVEIARDIQCSGAPIR